MTAAIAALVAVLPATITSTRSHRLAARPHAVRAANPRRPQPEIR